jgi:hypothetical protein
MGFLNGRGRQAGSIVEEDGLEEMSHVGLTFISWSILRPAAYTPLTAYIVN